VELSVQACLESLSISRLCDWDVLAFVCRHGVSLTSAEQIGSLIGYDSGMVGDALNRLEDNNLIERSRPSRGVRFYRVLSSTEAGRSSLQYLIGLSGSRTGRLMLVRQLANPPKPEREEQSARGQEMKGNDYA
jgi:DNA-binding MarR family transcriptional regulator